MQTCRKSKNYHDPQIEFRNLNNERHEEVWVDERARVGHLVSVVSVNDLDRDDRGYVKVTIIAGNEEGNFILDTSYGSYDSHPTTYHVIRVAGRGQLDREITSQYQLTVQAEDRGNLPVTVRDGPPPRTTTATLTVNIGGKGRGRPII